LDSNFTALFRRFISCYERDPNSLDVGLLQAEEGIEAIQNETGYEGESKAQKISRKRTKQALKKRLLAMPDFSRSALEGQASGLDPDSSNRKPPAETWDEFQQELLDQFLDILAKEWGITKTELNEFLASNGITGDRLHSLRQLPELKEIERKHRFAKDSEPKFELFFANEFADWLDLAVAKAEKLDEFSYSSSIPDHLGRFLHEAYRCDLYGFDAACASLCGAILQEAIRIKLNHDGFDGLYKAIEAARNAALFSETAANAAEEVMRLRNEAVHGNRKFIHASLERRKRSLPITREILDTLFAPEI